MKLLAVALLLLPLSACWAAVVGDFTERCGDFFAHPNGVPSPPTRFNDQNRYKQICQTLNNAPEYATFYDTKNKIPVYSAYSFYGPKNCTRKNGPWYIEPQLDDQKRGNHMTSESAVSLPPHGDNQALNADYSDSTKTGYEKGHLAPVCHQNKQRCADATFTLTNAAPQASSFNKKWYNCTEKDVSRILTFCTDISLQAYIVTGVVANDEGETLKNRVRIPTHFWTAYCCIDNNNIPIHSGAYIGANIKVKKEEECRNIVERKHVQDLEGQLKKLSKAQLGNNDFTLFGGGCYEEAEIPDNIEELQKLKKRKYPDCEKYPEETGKKLKVTESQ